MKLDEFISNVLQDIDKGMSSAKGSTNRDYFILTTDKPGVSFDIAVTTTKSSDAEVNGKANVGFIEVLGAGVGTTIGNKKEDSEASRIQFTIHVPPQTIEENQRIYQNHNRAQDIG